MNRPMRRILWLVLCLLASSPAPADQPDVVYLHNGDRISGSVKGLLSGQLELKTAYMGTVYIDWEDIQDLVSATGQQIELSDGRRLVGRLSKPEEPVEGGADLLTITGHEGAQTVESLDVVRMYPVGGDFWDRLDIYFGVGINYDKSSSVGKYNLKMDATYRDPGFITLANLSSEITSRDDAATTERNVLGVQHLAYLPNKRYRSYFGSLEQNEQLGVYLRTLLGVGYGWVPISDSRNWLTWGVGLAANHEKPLDGTDTGTHLEAAGTVRYQYYKHSVPKRTLDIYFQVLPSLTQSGRVRADFSADVKWEIVRDFFFGAELYTDYDSNPASTDAERVDYGIRTSVGLKF